MVLKPIPNLAGQYQTTLTSLLNRGFLVYTAFNGATTVVPATLLVSPRKVMGLTSE
jgi:hypothetical protein